MRVKVKEFNERTVSILLKKQLGLLMPYDNKTHNLSHGFAPL